MEPVRDASDERKVRAIQVEEHLVERLVGRGLANADHQLRQVGVERRILHVDRQGLSH
jgi:hypothetical protein